MISIIVPVYNVELYLKRCVESIINQSYTNLEIILVDDGSTDNSSIICDELKNIDERIRVIHKKNGGLSDARNAGIEIAKGEYIGFVDSDDWIEHDMFESLLLELEKSGAGVAVTGINRIYDNGYNVNQFIRDKIEIYEGKEIIRHYLQQDSFSTAAWDKLYRKELFKERRFPVGKLFEDAPVIYDILCNISKVVVIGKPHYHYFQRANSICGLSFSERKMDHYYFSKEIWMDVLVKYPDLKKEANIFWGCKLCELIFSLEESGNKLEFRKEKRILYNDFKNVWTFVVLQPIVPRIMRIKGIFSVTNTTILYIKIKSMLVKKG